MVDDVRDDPAIDAWCEALLAYESHARAERLREMRGDRSVKRFDDQGLHQPSVEFGRVLAIEALIPGLSDLRYVGEPLSTPVVLRKQGYLRGEAEFRDQVLDAAGVTL